MKRTSQSNLYLGEVEVTPGLEFISTAELEELGGAILDRRTGEIDFRFGGNLRALLDLKTVQSVSLLQSYAIPRPRGLLGNVHFPLLLRQIETARALSPRDAYRTFFIAAAGSDSSVMERIRQEIAAQTGLVPTNEKGDLWIRIRPSRTGQGGWETLVRLSPRPLVTREWRVCNLEGALNAATAQAMIRLAHPQPDDVFLNLGCGSGTLLIERLAFGRCRLAIGIDQQADHLACARQNITASRYSGITLEQMDMCQLGLGNHLVNTLCADLPFGQLSGSHQENQRLYPTMLAEAARVAQIGARFVLVTHEVHLMDGLLARNRQWAVERVVPINLRGLHPHIYVLRCTSHMN